MSPSTSTTMAASYAHSDMGHGSPSLKPTGLLRNFSLRSRKNTDSDGEKSWAKWSRKWRSSTTDSTSPTTTTTHENVPLIQVISSPFSVPLAPPPNNHRCSLFTTNSVTDSTKYSKFTLEIGSEVDLLSSTLASSSSIVIPATSQSSSLTPHPEASLLSSSDAPRPRLLRRDANISGSATSRRRTFAMAMTDEEITDEVLVEELEKMRTIRDWTGSSDDVSELWDLGCEPRSALYTAGPIYDSPSSESSTSAPSKIPYTPSLPSFPIKPNPATNAQWQTARRALLTCRECVRTERHYLSSLLTLLAGDTATPPPPLMLRYATELFKVGQVLLNAMEENPSAWGVAAAFLSNQESVEAAFVGWCGVVGGWFSGSGDEAGAGVTIERKGSKLRFSLVDEKDKEKEDFTSLSPLKRTLSGWRKSMPPGPSMSPASHEMPTPEFSSSSSSTSSSFSSGSSTSGSGRSTPATSFAGSFRSRRKEKEKLHMNLTASVVGSGASLSTSPVKSIRKPAVRDLAILPTQRVMRYVLLFRDLLTHTPSTSPSRALVERAVEAAERIANKCDRAQDNSSFICAAQITNSARRPSLPSSIPSVSPVPSIPTFSSTHPTHTTLPLSFTTVIVPSKRESRRGSLTSPRLMAKARSEHPNVNLGEGNQKFYPPSAFFSRIRSTSREALSSAAAY